VVWAHADSHLLNINGYNGVIGHAEIYLGYATLDARPLEIGGVGGVATGAWRRVSTAVGRASPMRRCAEAIRKMRDKPAFDRGRCPTD
jgi:hypothetical protein